MDKSYINNAYLNPLRTYRKLESSHKDEQKFQIMVEETDVLITIPKYINTEKAVKKCFQYISHLRQELKAYILIDLAFQHSLEPIIGKTNAPSIVKAMCDAAQCAQVGPFAAVAGSIAQMTSLMLAAWITQEIQENLQEKDIKQDTEKQTHSEKKTIRDQSLECKNQRQKDERHVPLLENSKSVNVIVENGGDIYIHSQKERIIGILSKPTEGESIGLRIHKNDSPVSICSSSSKIGHSLSFGNGDIAMVRAKNAALADALATAYCNMLKTSKDINKVIERAKKDAQIQIPNNPFNENEIITFLNKQSSSQSSLQKEDALKTSNFNENITYKPLENKLSQDSFKSGLEGVFLQCDGHIGVWGKIELVAL